MGIRQRSRPFENSWNANEGILRLKESERPNRAEEKDVAHYSAMY